MAVDNVLGVAQRRSVQGSPPSKVARSLQTASALVRAKPLGALGGALIALLVLTAIFAPTLAPHDPIQIKSADRLQPPGLTYPLGTDDFGRDILSRIIHGARISMLIGLGAVGISTSLATIIGVISGFYGGKVDTVLQRCIDTLMAFPGLVVLLTIMAMLGQGLGNVILALGIGGTAGNARIIRSAVLAIKENQYIEAARAAGCRDWRIILWYILPNIAAPIMVVATLGLGVAILAESSLSFLGFGVPPPTPSWGGMLSGSGRTYMLKAPWMAIFPGIAISLAVFGFNMLGDALRDLLDPRLRGGTQGHV
jgi:peptide/nickel transport system permease protein